MKKTNKPKKLSPKQTKNVKGGARLSNGDGIGDGSGGRTRQ